MDPSKIDGLKGALSAAYRAAFKLRSLQKLCQLDGVRTSSLSSVLQSHGRNVGPGDKITQDEMGACLQRLFQGVSQDPTYQMTPDAIEHTTRLLFKLFDREQSGFVLLRSVEAVLIALSGDSLSAKHAALFQLVRSCSEEQDSSTVSHSGLRSVLEDLSQVPVVVQESHAFGQVDTAVQSCFQEILDGSVPEERFLCWLRTEPQLLLWLSTLSRVSASEAVVHQVCCHTCKTFPIIGLRYRCLRCLNLHLCQTCFLAQRGTRKHKPSHPVLEYCTQPSLRESFASLAHQIQEKFRKRHFGRKEAETRSAVCTPETHNRAELSIPALTHDKSTEPKANFETTPSQPRAESKAMQTDASPQTQEKTLLFKQDLYQTQMALRDLQREKRQLQKQFQVWISSAQSEHKSLKNKCCQMEAAMEVVVHHNQNLQKELLSVQQMMEALTKEEEDTRLSDTKHPKAEKMVYNSSQTETETASASSHEERTAQMSHKVSGWSSGNVIAQKPSKLSEWHPLDENQELKSYEDSTHWQDSHPGRENQNNSNAFVEQEAQLFDLVQRLKSSLTLNQQRGSISVPQGELLVAAEVVRSSISQLVSAISLCSTPSSQTR